MPVSRIFTPSEVEALIPQLAELVEKQLHCQSQIEECLAELAREGGGLPKSLDPDEEDPEEIARLKRELVARMSRYDTGWQEVQKLGAVVKDPQIGLVDFYGRIDGRLVWLCWRYGEETLRYFHELDSGYSGRKPLRPEARGTSPELMDRKRAERAVEEFLRALGRDPSTDPELAETPRRVAEAWSDELLTGYDVDIPGLFAEASPAKGECRLVVLDDIAVTTICPHHLLPAMGRARLAYRPGDRVFGLGTLSRVIDAMSRRLVLQESIAENVVDALVKHGGVQGAYCEITLRHGCLSARGGQEVDARVRTHAANGVLALPEAAAEIALAFREDR